MGVTRSTVSHLASGLQIVVLTFVMSNLQQFAAAQDDPAAPQPQPLNANAFDQLPADVLERDPTVTGGAPQEDDAGVPIIRDIQSAYPPIALKVNRSKVLEMNINIRQARFTQPVGPAEVDPLSPQRLLLTGRSAGTTQMVLTDDQDREYVFDIVVDPDLARLETAIRQVAPRAEIEYDYIQESIVLRGRVADIEEAERVLAVAQLFTNRVQNVLRVGGVQQVMVRCTFAEVSRNAIRNLGINFTTWGQSFFMGSNVGDIARTGFGLPSGLPLGAQVYDPKLGIGRGGVAAPITRGGYVPYTSINAIEVGASPQNIYFGVPSWQFQPFITALRENQLLRILAEPTLVAMSGQEASFLAGGEFPFAVPQPGDNATVTIEFKTFGVGLDVRPTVLQGQAIRMEVSPTVSDLDFANGVAIGGTVVPALTRRSVTTTVEMGNGQTLAIAGLLNQTINSFVQKIPGAGDVPILGLMFTSKRYEKNETELLVLITPELVEPMHPSEVRSVPGQLMTEPNDWQFFGLSEMEGRPLNYGLPDEAQPPTSVQGSGLTAGAGTEPAPSTINLRGPFGTAEPGEETPQ